MKIVHFIEYHRIIGFIWNLFAYMRAKFKKKHLFSYLFDMETI